LFTDVTGQSIRLIFKGQAVKEEGWTTQQMDLLLLHGWCGWLNGSRGGKGANKVAGARSFYQDMGGE